MAEPIVRDPDRARAARLLRRAGLGLDRGTVDRLADRDWESGVAALLDDAAVTVPGGGEPPVSDDWTGTVTWWLHRMVDPAGGLAERLTWFWHTFLTTNADKVESAGSIRDQLVLLRSHATGDYRSLLHAYVGSGALLEYLDASWSMASNPNENLARELMELFTIGRGNYSEDDVRAGARALAGWVVDEDGVEWRRENAFVAPLLFRGIQEDWDTAKIIDHLCDQPETATNVASRLWYHLTGDAPDHGAAADLGRWWQDRDLAILDLVERILLDPVSRGGATTRPRTGLEWYVAALSATGAGIEFPWPLEQVGQVPYDPPNVGGWPDGERWLSPGSLLGRVVVALELDPAGFDRGRSATTDDILDRCGLHEVSPATLEAIESLSSTEEITPDAVHRLRWWLALTSPEFNLL